jgi:ATP-dependent DNA ligase
MFNELFFRSDALTRHLSAPLVEERRQYLAEEAKLDGFRTVAFKSNGRVHLRSRNDNDFASRYPSVGQALESLPDETVIDGQVVPLDEQAAFNILQNLGSSKAPIVFYVLDVMVIGGRDEMREPLTTRLELLEQGDQRIGEHQKPLV